MSVKYQLETIPVWDGISSQSECFICDLMEEAQKDSISFYLGSSVMNPETRVKVNATGFCPQDALSATAWRKGLAATALQSPTFGDRTCSSVKPLQNPKDSASRT